MCRLLASLGQNELKASINVSSEYQGYGSDDLFGSGMHLYLI